MEASTAIVPTTDRDERLEAFDRVEADLRRLEEAKFDARTPTAALTAVPTDDWSNAGIPNRIRIDAATPKGTLSLRVLPGAHEQIAEKTGIPRKYYDRMLQWEPELLATNINVWFRSEPEVRMLRMLRPINEAEAATNAGIGASAMIRAVLASNYRPIDHGPIMEHVIPVIRENGGVVQEYRLTDRNFHIRFVGPERDIQEVVAEVKRRQPDVAPHFTGLHEVLQGGVAIRNSETGHGAIWVEPIVKVLRCINLLVVNEKLRAIHRGGKKGDETFFQTDTRRLADSAKVLQVRDKVIELFTPATFEKAAIQIAENMGVEIPKPDDVPMMDFVEGVGRGYDLTEGEIGVLRDEFLSEIQATGRTDRWSLSQAFTASARRLDDDFDRKREIEAVGWEVLEDPTLKFLAAGKRKKNGAGS